MKVLGNRVLVKRVEEVKAEGYQTVQVQDNFIYKGIVVAVSWPEKDLSFKVGDTILFAKYSPDTHEIDIDGEKQKFVSIPDILAVV